MCQQGRANKDATWMSESTEMGTYSLILFYTLYSSYMLGLLRYSAVMQSHICILHLALLSTYSLNIAPSICVFNLANCQSKIQIKVKNAMKAQRGIFYLI